MRIVYITEQLPTGPGEPFIIPEITALLARGHQVLILPLLDLGQPVHQDAQPLLAHAVRLPVDSVEFGKTVRRQWCRQPYRAVSALASAIALSPRRWQLRGNLDAARKGLYIAQLVEQWQPDHIHAHWANFTATMALVLSRMTGIPWSFTAHRYDIAVNNGLATKIRRAAFSRFISSDGMALAEEVLKTSLPATCIRLPMGVPVEDRSDAACAMTEKPVLLCPANLVPVKGHRYLLDAMARLQRRGVKVDLWLAGSGELEQEITGHIRQAGLSETVTMLGRVSHDRIVGWYRERRVTAVVIPSLSLPNGLKEGIPVALMEAMSYGIPVLATSSGGIPELLGEGAGLLVPPADAAALADAIESLMRDSSLRQSLGEAGRNRIVRDYNLATICEALVCRWQNAGVTAGK